MNWKKYKSILIIGTFPCVFFILFFSTKSHSIFDPISATIRSLFSLFVVFILPTCIFIPMIYRTENGIIKPINSKISNVEALHLARGAGMYVLKAMPPLRRMVIQQGLGPQSGLPRMMRKPESTMDCAGV